MYSSQLEQALTIFPADYIVILVWSIVYMSVCLSILQTVAIKCYFTWWINTQLAAVDDFAQIINDINSTAFWNWYLGLESTWSWLIAPNTLFIVSMYVRVYFVNWLVNIKSLKNRVRPFFKMFCH